MAWCGVNKWSELGKRKKRNVRINSLLNKKIMAAFYKRTVTLEFPGFFNQELSRLKKL